MRKVGSVCCVLLVFRMARTAGRMTDDGGMVYRLSIARSQHCQWSFKHLNFFHRTRFIPVAVSSTAVDWNICATAYLTN